ncbi:PMS1 protein homolog 1-like isoform X2 [Stegodyphus dumicola]|uniref:PMS1 protein homolog 1-like isoform X2 n=1 Tax=Stegodyphus dumicola TaxID=202533 RepID=UPI0015AF2B8E|nr:PMS1 protein homolog 1-like isoform X2 [Stegodyphus dumicola]
MVSTPLSSVFDAQLRQRCLHFEKKEDYGLEKIEVKDNGSGIHKNDIPLVVKPHFTSKITSHLDLDKVQTYGFRGEALAALCAVSDLVITTKRTDEDIGFIYTFNHNGEVINQKPCSCSQGTTVAAFNLFKNIPVRRQFYRSIKNKKEELKNVEDILISFGCIQTGVRFILGHNKHQLWQKTVVRDAEAGLIQVFGNSVVDHLEKIDYFSENIQMKLEIFLPKRNSPSYCGYSSSTRCIVAVNKRPVRMKAIDKILKEYHNNCVDGSSSSRYPICYLSITLPLASVDVNVEPNKTSVLLHNMDEILEELSKLLSTFYETSSSTQKECRDPSSSGNYLLNNEQEKFNGHKMPDTSENLLKNPTFDKQIQHSMLSSQLGNPVWTGACKETLSASKKMSRKNNLITPTNKRMKTSTGSTLPADDVLKHINTMNKFFSSKENVPEDKNKLLESNLKPTENLFAITVQRNDFRNTGNKTTDLDQCNNKNSSSVAELANNSGLIAMECALTSERKSSSLQPCEVTISTDNSSTFYATKSWSHGIHPDGKFVQPVSVLKPKMPCRSSNTDENILHVQSLEEKSSGTNNKIHKDNDKIEFPNNISELQRKLTAFDYFCRQNRLEVAAQNPEFNNHQIAQVLTEKWSHLSEEEKAAFKSLASKGYPKNVKKKEKVSKALTQQLCKKKTVSRLSANITMKRKQKVKEKEVIFSIQMVQDAMKMSFQKEKKGNFDLINPLAPGVWLCRQNNKLYLLNTFRLQETIIYYTLLETYQFEAEPLNPPYEICLSSLGNDEILQTVLHLWDTAGSVSGDPVLDERLTANGFNLRILKDGNEVALELMGKTPKIAFYGIEDLKEILILLKQKGYSAKLSDCRPGKVILYLQGEAVRIARQCPANPRIDDVEELLKKREMLPSECTSCIHMRPFFHELHSIHEAEKSCS